MDFPTEKFHLIVAWKLSGSGYDRNDFALRNGEGNEPAKSTLGKDAVRCASTAFLFFVRESQTKLNFLGLNIPKNPLNLGQRPTLFVEGPRPGKLDPGAFGA